VIASIELGGRSRLVDLANGASLAIPQMAGGGHPKFFITEDILTEPLEIGGFTGQVNSGCSCNVERLHMVPHCHGTHTEGPGHLTTDAMPIQHHLDLAMTPAILISVQPDCNATDPEDGQGPVIVAGQLEIPEEARAVIIRTLPNPADKCRRDYARATPYPVLSMEAVDKLVTAGVQHLLIDAPSVDPADDGGRLARHRRFWGMQTGATQAATDRAHCTITEMIYAPDSIADGLYLLSLGVSALHSDAAASAPVIYPIS
jgi:arylformamidase